MRSEGRIRIYEAAPYARTLAKGKLKDTMPPHPKAPPMQPQISANLRDLAKGIRMGIGFFIGIGSMWAIVAFAAATWGNLPTVSSGSGLTSTAWNDVVGQVNVLAGAIGVSGGNVGIGVSGTPAAKLDVNGDVIIRGSLTTAGNLGSPFYSVMPNDMSFAAGGSVLGSVTSPMPVGTYFYQIYGCSGQNNFSAGATGNIVFVTGGGSATNTDYFDNTNF
ncbi:MAG: hypothetical protein QG650_446 [Patescibacteria group bacterium]|nr:hypothetical protein [Patescibacteria group bacterium]